MRPDALTIKLCPNCGHRTLIEIKGTCACYNKGCGFKEE